MANLHFPLFHQLRSERVYWIHLNFCIQYRGLGQFIAINAIAELSTWRINAYPTFYPAGFLHPQVRYLKGSPSTILSTVLGDFSVRYVHEDSCPVRSGLDYLAT